MKTIEIQCDQLTVGMIVKDYSDSDSTFEVMIIDKETDTLLLRQLSENPTGYTKINHGLIPFPLMGGSPWIQVI